MSEQIEGYVTKILEKSGTGRNGKPYTLYSIRIQKADGELDPKYYNFGFDKPPFKCDENTDGNGDYVKFEAKAKSDIASDVLKGTGKVVKNAPARDKKARADKATKAAKTTKSELFGEIGGYNTESDVARMTYANARTAAIEAVDVLLKHDALVYTKATAKANQAKRYQEVVDAIDKLTVKYFYDSASQRVLENVADDVIKEMKAAPLPDDAEEEELAAQAEYDASAIPPDPDEEEGTAVGF